MSREVHEVRVVVLADGVAEDRARRLEFAEQFLDADVFVRERMGVDLHRDPAEPTLAIGKLHQRDEEKPRVRRAPGDLLRMEELRLECPNPRHGRPGATSAQGRRRR